MDAIIYLKHIKSIGTIKTKCGLEVWAQRTLPEQNGRVSISYPAVLIKHGIQTSITHHVMYYYKNPVDEESKKKEELKELESLEV